MRAFDAACWIIAGIALLIVSQQPGVTKSVWPVLGGLAAAAYGVKIAATRTSYWRHSLVYMVAVGAIIYAISTL